MDKTASGIIVIIILAAVLFWAVQSGFLSSILGGGSKPASLPEGIVLFYGAECPHCKNVEAFVSANNIDQKVKFTNLEVSFAGKTSPQLKADDALALQVAEACKMDITSGVSIPLLFDGKDKCFSGDVDVINFFKNEAGIK
ncbi:MAG: hypothetical protein NTY04_01050 [Candidatus Staskawiczbacteria bacterium]|nr:hypothetical protein [Candidatus Staskawiczbacteria bacterium]